MTNKNVQATEETKAISPKRDIRLKQIKPNKKSIIESKKKDLKIVVPEFYNYEDKFNGESLNNIENILSDDESDKGKELTDEEQKKLFEKLRTKKKFYY